MEAAKKPQRTREERLELIKAARSRFTDALGVERDKARISLVSLHLGLCWLLLGNVVDAREWTAKAHEAAVQAMKEILSKAVNHNGPSESEVINNITAFAAFFSWPILFMLGPNLWEKATNRKSEELRRLALSQGGATTGLH